MLMNLRIQKIAAWPVCLIFLVALCFGGTGYVLCIGDDGHIEFKTFCFPTCGEAKEVCEADALNDLHHEHSDRSSCTDIELNGPLWSLRTQKTASNQLGQFTSAPTIDALFDIISTGNSNSQTAKFHLVYGQSPPSYSITAIVLRC